MTARIDPESLLALRDWVLCGICGSGSIDRPTARRAAAVPERIWVAFLALERCALEVSAILERDPHSLPHDIQRLIREKATIEFQRFLSAVGQIRRIAAMVQASDTRVVVLKGGVAAIAGCPIALDDVDILIPARDEETLVAALDREGYVAWGEEVPSTPRGRYEPEAVPVDLHRRIHLLGDPTEILTRAQPIPSLAGVLRPCPADHLWHLLVHATHHHPDRRGRIRDLMIMALAFSECEATDLDEITARLDRHADPEPLKDHLIMARQLAAGEPVEDRFRDLALVKYDAAARLGWLDYGKRTRILRMLTIRSLCGRRPLVREIWDLGEIQPGLVSWLRRSAGFAVAGLLARWLRFRQGRLGRPRATWIARES